MRYSYSYIIRDCDGEIVADKTRTLYTGSMEMPFMLVAESMERKAEQDADKYGGYSVIYKVEGEVEL